MVDSRLSTTRLAVEVSDVEIDTKRFLYSGTNYLGADVLPVHSSLNESGKPNVVIYSILGHANGVGSGEVPPIKFRTIELLPFSPSVPFSLSSCFTNVIGNDTTQFHVIKRDQIQDTAIYDIFVTDADDSGANTVNLKVATYQIPIDSTTLFPETIFTTGTTKEVISVIRSITDEFIIVDKFIFDI